MSTDFATLQTPDKPASFMEDMGNMTNLLASGGDFHTINASRDYILQDMTDSQKHLLSAKRENMRNFLP